MMKIEYQYIWICFYCTILKLQKLRTVRCPFVNDPYLRQFLQNCFNILIKLSRNELWL